MVNGCSSTQIWYYSFWPMAMLFLSKHLRNLTERYEEFENVHDRTWGLKERTYRKHSNKIRFRCPQDLTVHLFYRKHVSGCHLEKHRPVTYVIYVFVFHLPTHNPISWHLFTRCCSGQLSVEHKIVAASCVRLCPEELCSDLDPIAGFCDFLKISFYSLYWSIASVDLT